MSEKIREGMKSVASAVMLLLTVVAIAAVIWRVAAKYISWIDGTAFYWANELQLLLLHWVVVVGMAADYISDSANRINLFLDTFSHQVKKSFRAGFNLLDICVFSVVVIWGGKLAFQEWDTPTSSLMWSRGLFVYFPYVLLGAFVVYYSVYQLVRWLRDMGKES